MATKRGNGNGRRTARPRVKRKLAPFAAPKTARGDGGDGGNGDLLSVEAHDENVVEGAIQALGPTEEMAVSAEQMAARHEHRLEPALEGGPRANPLVRTLRNLREGLDIRGLGSKGGYGTMPILLLTMFAVIQEFDGVAFTQLLLEIQRYFQQNLQQLIQIFFYIGIVGILLSGPVGYLGDRWKRVWMTAGGAIMSSLGSLFTPLAPGRAGLISVRAFGRQGDILASPAYFSLIADYYPLEERGRAFTFREIGTNIGAVVAPLIVGVIATKWGWKAPFLMIGAVGAMLSLLLFRLKEPVRGYHERKAYGADEETARQEQDAPTFAEAWRAATSVRTLRRICYAIPFTFLASYAIGIFLYLQVLPRVFDLSILERGYVLSMQAGAGILGLAVGGPLVGKLLARNPGRVVILNGLAGITGAIMIMGIAFTRNLPIALVLIFLFGFVDYVIAPAQLAVSSAVIPPRLRGLGRAVINYYRLPALIVGLPIIFFVAGSYGSRAGIVLLTPVSILGAIIQMTAGPFVEFDIRSATSASMAAEEWRRAKATGRAKMLVIRNLDIHYETVQVLFGVDLDVQQGEILALLGTNGAGKSTLLKAISGTVAATGGAIVFDGRDTTHVPPHEVLRYGIVHMPGGRSIFPGLSVRENLKLAGWLYGQDPKHEAEVRETFNYFPMLEERLDQEAGTLSGGEQQMLGLAQAFLSRPRLLMIDELSLGLSPAIVEQLLGIIRDIHANGTTIILVEQSVNLALTVAKRAVFMEKGEIRFDGPTADLLKRPDIMRAVFLKGAASASGSLRVNDPTAGSAMAGGPATRRSLDGVPAVLSLKDISVSYGGVKAVDGASVDVREGEILGMIGPNGAGKTTLLEIASGFVMPEAGTIIFDGVDITALSPEARARMRLIRRFQDARLFPSLTVGETMAVAFERQFDSRSIFVEALQLPQARVAELRVRRRVDRLIELLELGAYRDKFISELSTGTRRVVDIACVLATEPKVLLLDEPTSGMAQREAESLVPLLLRVRHETGCSMLVVEHDIPLISSLADELLAMDLGKVVTRGVPDAVLEDERVVRAYLGTSEEVIQRSGQS